MRVLNLKHVSWCTVTNSLLKTGKNPLSLTTPWTIQVCVHRYSKSATLSRMTFRTLCRNVLLKNSLCISIYSCVEWYKMRGKGSKIPVLIICKSGMDTVVHSSLFHNSVNAIAFSTVCCTFVVIPKTFSVLHKSFYRAQFTCTSRVWESQLGSEVTLLWIRELCSTLVAELCTVLP